MSSLIHGITGRKTTFLQGAQLILRDCYRRNSRRSSHSYIDAAMNVNGVHENHEKRLRILISKEIKKEQKRIAFDGESAKAAALREKVMNDQGFAIVPSSNWSQLMQLRKDYRDESITVDFDAWNPAIGEEMPQVFDVIISKKENRSVDYRMVVTCSVKPFRPLSLRFVPNDCDHLDQSIYDGPDLFALAPGLQSQLPEILHTRGVTKDTAEFVKLESMRKHRAQRAAALLEMTSVFFPSAPHP
jgi:hypothetical protein